MPQMSPLNWLVLFFYFTMVFIMFNVMNYFSFLYKSKKSNLSSIKKIKYTWKW